MIYYNGKALEAAAPVDVVDVLVSPIQLNAATQERPLFGGEELVRITPGTRTVEILFALLTDSLATRQQQLRQITAWARSSTPARLALPGHDGLYLEAVCTGLPSPSMRDWWADDLKIVFTCFDNPYWTSVQEKTSACGTAFTVLGDAPPLMRIERTLSAAASNQAYARSGQSMSFSTVPAGKLVIDLNRQTAAVNGQSIMQYYPLTGATFLRPQLGTQTITGTGTVYWRERWE